MDIEKIKRLKSRWIDTSFILGLVIPLIASFIIEDWSVYTGAISDFGTQPATAGFWPVYIVISAIGLWINGTSLIEQRYEGFKSHVLYYMLNASCTGLFLVAIITEEYRYAHGAVAAVFFLVYMLFIFLYGLWQIKKLSFKEGSFSVTIGILLLLTTLLMIPFTGLAMFEITYLALIIFWNWAVNRKTPVDKIIGFFSRGLKK